LKELGLTKADLKCLVGIYGFDAFDREVLREEVEIQRIESGTFNNKFEPTDGPDMVFHYVDLQGRRMTYLPKGARNEKNLYRVRYENPLLHKDKYGEPIKYQSPPQSGCPVWIPNPVLKAYKNGVQFDTLYITEGELKAEKAAKHGMYTIGLMGINNLAENQTLPKEFQMIINKCGVKRVCFILDADAFDLSEDLAEKPKKSATFRPSCFLSAVSNFKDYFTAFANHGIYLELYFAYLLKNEDGEKGLDDLMAGSLKKEPQVFEGEIRRLMTERGTKTREEGILRCKGKYAEVITLTDVPKSQLKRLWGLEDVKSFYNRFRESLNKLGRFVFYRDAWVVKDAHAGEIELAQPITADERFWNIETSESSNGTIRTKASFVYNACYKFLHSRNIGRFKMNKSLEFIFILAENRIVTELQAYEIKDYVTDFVQRIGETDVLEMIFRSSNKYLGKESLSNLPFLDIKFPIGERDSQHFYFQNQYWQIKPTGVSARGYNELPHNVWRERLKDFHATILPPLVSTEKDEDGDYPICLSEDWEKCDVLRFLALTSEYNWRDKEKGYTVEQCREHTFSLLTKLTAIGYLLHDFRNPAVAKAVIAMDIKNSEVGSSFGRTGKSLIGLFIEQMVPTIIFDGKKKKLMDDDFMLEQVDHRTQCLVFDDVRKEIDFEGFFSLITGVATINKKGVSKFKLESTQALKLFFSTNHAISGTGSSFKDRQVLLGFSDYFNPNRKPSTEFGKEFFSDEWDAEQWNLFYNLMANCVQLYLQHGIIQAPAERLEVRKLRQEIGEEFLTWAEEFFSSDDNLNLAMERKAFHEKVEKEVKGAIKWSTRTIKNKLKAYCQYAGLHFNPSKPDEEGREWQQGQNWPFIGGDHKTNGTEYYIIANNHWKPELASAKAEHLTLFPTK
jgi:DNA primase